MDDPDLRARVSLVRELIARNDLQAARSILLTIDHPTAREWIGQIDAKLASQQTRESPVFEEARRLIEAGQLNEARERLVRTNDPASIAWIRAIDSGSYGPPVSPPLPQQKERKPALSNTATALLGMIAIIICGSLFCALFVPGFQPSYNSGIISCSLDVGQIGEFSTSTLSTPAEFQERISDLLEGYARIVWFEAPVNAAGRLTIRMDLDMADTSNSRACALKTIETVLRVFGAELAGNKAGSVYVLTSWYVGSQICTGNAGMGYLVAERINWDTVSQQTIFNTIDQNNDGDANRYLLAFAPAPSYIAEVCNR